VLAKVNPFGIRAIVGDAKLNTEKTAVRGSGDIYIDNAVPRFIVLQKCGYPIQQEAFAALVFGWLGLSFQIPARRICWDRERLQGLRLGNRQRDKNTKSEMSNNVSEHMLTVIPAAVLGELAAKS
jgi:hypothetical protein